VTEPRILVVDDEPAVLELIVEALTRAGYSPCFTSESREALRFLETTPFDVVLTDTVMPHLGGLDLLEIAKRQNPDVQVLFVTGDATAEMARQALKKGAAGFIEKPFQPDRLLAVVREALLPRLTQAGPGVDPATGNQAGSNTETERIRAFVRQKIAAGTLPSTSQISEVAAHPVVRDYLCSVCDRANPRLSLTHSDGTVSWFHLRCRQIWSQEVAQTSQEGPGTPQARNP